MEIVRYFLRSLPKSPRLLAIVVGTSVLAGLVALAMSGAPPRRLAAGNVLNAGGLALGVFCFFVFLVFIQGKTQERTMSVSEQGIATSIGSLRAVIPWTKITTVQSVGRHVLIVRSSGNSFLVPMRAFAGPEQYAQFLAAAQGWLEESR